MKEFLFKIKNKLNNLTVFDKINPHKYWNRLLFLFLSTLLILVIFSIYLLSQIKNQQIFQTIEIEKETPVWVNEKLFKNINEYFNSKNIEKIIESDHNIDPSL